MTRPYFLNEAVNAVVKADLTLWAMWIVTRDPYDDEIEPLHNSSWVKQAQENEARHLDRLQKKLAQAKSSL